MPSNYAFERPVKRGTTARPAIIIPAAVRALDALAAGRSTRALCSFFRVGAWSAMFRVRLHEGRPMNATVKSLGIDRLGLDDRLKLVEEIWDLIGAKDEEIPLTNAQRAELERRMAEDDARPADTIAWEEVKSSTLSRLGK
jgi:putative addiction module component (TIGR02574 family)